MKKLIGTLIPVVCLIIGSVAVQAATLTDITGEIRLNKGEGFKVVTEAVTVKRGDKIMAADKASAKVVYSNGYALKVRPGHLMTVSTAERVKMRSGMMRLEGDAALPPSFPVIPIAIGVGVIAGVVAIVSSRDKDRPVSR